MTMRYVIPAFVMAVVLGGGAYLSSRGVTAPAFAESVSPAAAAAPASTAPAVASTPATASPKVAEVAGEVITKADVEQLYTAIKQRAGEGTPPLDKVFWMLTDQIIASRLIIAQAKAQNLEATPEVQNALKMAHEQILQEAYVRKLFAGLDADAALKARYQALADTYKGQEEIHARHILVETEAQAKDLITKLNGGADFAKLAQENSKDQGTKEQGGDLGFFAKEAMVPEFATAAFALQPGKITTEPVKTQFGWHVIKLEERRARPAPSFEDVKPQLLSDAQREKLEKTISDLRTQANVKHFAAPGVPAVPPEGGVVGQNTGTAEPAGKEEASTSPASASTSHADIPVEEMKKDAPASQTPEKVE